MAFKGDDSTFSLAATITLALAVTAMVFVKEPLKSSRPMSNAGEVSTDNQELRVNARLWEDPFAAVEKDRRSRQFTEIALTVDGKIAPISHSPEGAPLVAGEVSVLPFRRSTADSGLGVLKDRLKSYTNVDSHAVTILIIMTGNGFSVEDSEWRIRDRYAVGAALEAGCFAPEDTQTLSYFTWHFDANPSPQNQAHSVAVPYEWYRLSKIAACRVLDSEELVGKVKERHVLLLWMAADDLEKTALKRTQALLETILPERSPSVEAKIIGPRSSEEFRGLLREIEKRTDEQVVSGQPSQKLFSWNFTNRIELYSPWATAMPGLLSYGLESRRRHEVKGCLSYAICQEVYADLLSDAGVALSYTIDNDGVLFESLFKELARRQVNVGDDPIALIGEWDSFYARALPLTFSAAACHHSRRCSSIDEAIDMLRKGEISPKIMKIRQYSYLSGLDGEASENQSPTPTTKGERRDKGKSDEKKSRLRDIDSYERPEGGSQLDYVRRLVARIKLEDQQEEGESRKSRKVKAIGILGRDAYDALLILQALRDEFPSTLFFATDLDARFFHKDEQKWTRNLIIVSHFGLQLDGHLQQAIPPFRSTLQTSTFFAVLRAIGHVRQNNSPPAYVIQEAGHGPRHSYDTTIHPRLFEIGRSGAVDLSVDGLRRERKSVHPLRSDVDTDAISLRVPERINLLWIVCMTLMTLAVWCHTSVWNWIVARTDGDGIARWAKVTARSSTILALIVSAYFFWAAFQHFNYVEDEPFSWSDGVSIWPTELLRVFAAGLCIFFLIKARADAISNTESLTRRFFPALHPEQRHQDDWWSSVKAVWRNLDWMFHGSPLGQGVPASMLWAQYCQAHSLPQRVVRIVVWLLIYSLLVLPLLFYMEDGEGRLFVPCRGIVSCRLDEIITHVSVLFFVILNVAVLDAVVLCTRWIREMPSTDGLSPMAKVHLIAERTTVVNRRILYPFLVLLLLIAARSHYFDYWDFPSVLILVLTVNCLVALTSACMLYLAAVGARRQVLLPLEQEYEQILSLPEEAKPGERQERSLENLREVTREIETVQQGAFVPFYQQPVVQAALVAAFAFLQYWYLGQ